ncbi:hypothetical protein RYX36_000345, partial [Vicia faba]
MEYDIHTILDLVTFVTTVWVIYMIRFKLKASYMEEKANFAIYYVVAPCAALALVIHPSTSHHILNRIFWAFCVYLEAVSVLPQLRVMQNTKIVESFTAHYVFALGVARFLSCAHWVLQPIAGFKTILYRWNKVNIARKEGVLEQGECENVTVRVLKWLPLWWESSLGACLSLCHMLKACRKILPPPPATTALFEQQPPFSVEIQLPPPPPPLDTTLYALFKQQSPFSVEIQLPPPPPPPLSSSLDNDLVEELPQLPSPPLSAYEELPPPPTLLSPPTLPSPSTPVPWRRQLPRVGGLYPPVGWYTLKQLEKKLEVAYVIGMENTGTGLAISRERKFPQFIFDLKKDLNLPESKKLKTADVKTILEKMDITDEQSKTNFKKLLTFFLIELILLCPPDPKVPRSSSWAMVDNLDALGNFNWPKVIFDNLHASFAKLKHLKDDPDKEQHYFSGFAPIFEAVVFSRIQSLAPKPKPELACLHPPIQSYSSKRTGWRPLNTIEASE